MERGKGKQKKGRIGEREENGDRQPTIFAQKLHWGPIFEKSEDYLKILVRSS